jgi:hypothetical protein
MRPWLPILLAIVLLGGCSKKANPLLTMQIPPNWKVRHWMENGVGQYTIAARDPFGGVTLSQWQAPGRSADIPRLMQSITDKFVAMAKGDPRFTLTNPQPQIQSFVGEHCQGSYVTFSVSPNAGDVQITFLIGVDDQLWKGQFIGPPAVWEKMLTVLKNIRLGS